MRSPTSSAVACRRVIHSIAFGGLGHEALVGLTVIIGAITDIHGNLAALEAIIRQMPPVDVTVCAGDIAGYYPDANQVCKLVRGFGALVVRGNHDAYVTGELEPDAAKVAGYRTAWVRESLEPEHRKWLNALPVEIRFLWGGRRLTVRHASPWDDETYLYPDSPHLSRIGLRSEEVMIVGHTHWPMVKRCGDGLLVNPGSVGQPRDWNPMAAYAVVDLETASVTQNRVPYDIAGLQRRLTEMGWDASTVAIPSQAR